MNGASLVALVIRTVLSLAVILAIVAVAYRVAKRRANGTAPRPSSSAGRGGNLFGAARRSAPAPIEVVGRVGLTRGAAAVAVRFGERIVLVSASDQGPASVLAEMSGDQWDELTTVPEVASPIIGGIPSPHGAASAAQRPSFVEALRQATTRHA